MRVALKDVVAGYGFGDILRGLDLVAESGEITCLIGPNGAGKSTVLRTISGLLRPRRGTIRLDETDIGGLSPKRLLSLGVVHVPQERSLFPLMTVWENLLLGGYVNRDRRTVRRRADELAERFPLIAERRRERAGSLSGGGWTVLLVEQNARSGLAVAQRGAVLDGGVVKLVGSGTALLGDPEVARLYLGAGSSSTRVNMLGRASSAAADTAG